MSRNINFTATERVHRVVLPPSQPCLIVGLLQLQIVLPLLGCQIIFRLLHYTQADS